MRLVHQYVCSTWRATFYDGSSLQAVLAQRLVRVICESCRQEHQLSPMEREWLSADLVDAIDEHHHHAGRGCGHCNGTGYRSNWRI